MDIIDSYKSIIHMTKLACSMRCGEHEAQAGVVSQATPFAE